jgi:hypothetical protein
MIRYFVILGFEFDVPLDESESNQVIEEVANTSQDLMADFSPDGKHLFVRCSHQVKTIVGGPIGKAVDGPITKAILQVRAIGTWRKIFDATHEPDCSCTTCRTA